jgi:hypothetical protein
MEKLKEYADHFPKQSAQQRSIKQSNMLTNSKEQGRLISALSLLSVLS